MPEVIDEQDVMQTQGEPQVEPTPAPEPKDEEWKQAIADLATQVKTATAPKEDKPAELTEEQKAEMWAIYNPEKSRKDFFQKWFRLNEDATPEQIAEAKELFADMQKGLVKQALVGARNMYSAELEKLREEIAPLREHVSSQRAEATRKRFFDEYSSLADPKFSNVVNLTAKGLAEKNFSSEAEYFKALAEGAAATIKAVLPDFDLGAVAAPKKTSGTTPKLPRTSVGGTGGTGGGATKLPAGDPRDASADVLD